MSTVEALVGLTPSPEAHLFMYMAVLFTQNGRRDMYTYDIWFVRRRQRTRRVPAPWQRWFKANIWTRKSGTRVKFLPKSNGRIGFDTLNLKFARLFNDNGNSFGTSLVGGGTLSGKRFQRSSGKKSLFFFLLCGTWNVRLLTCQSVYQWNSHAKFNTIFYIVCYVTGVVCEAYNQQELVYTLHTNTMFYCIRTM